MSEQKCTSIFYQKLLEMRNKQDEKKQPETLTYGPYFQSAWPFPRARGLAPAVCQSIEDSSCDPLTPQGMRQSSGQRFFSGTFRTGWASSSPSSTVMGLFRLSTVGQEPQPAWTMGTFNNSRAGGSARLSLT